MNFLDFTINAVLRPTFIQKLCYKLSSIVTFTFIQVFFQNCAFFTEWHHSGRVCLTQWARSSSAKRPAKRGAKKTYLAELLSTNLSQRWDKTFVLAGSL